MHRYMSVSWKTENKVGAEMSPCLTITNGDWFQMYIFKFNICTKSAHIVKQKCLM